MKDITQTALAHLLAAHPNAEIVEIDGNRIVRVPMYDIETDRAWTEERRIVSDPDQTPMGTLPVLNVRKGEKFNPEGEARESPLGHLYRIVGWTPPPKDDKD